MNIVIAIDSFKGSLSSMEAGRATKEGILQIFPESDISVCPIADGGEGTVQALVDGMNGVYNHITVSGPLLKKISCGYGIVPQDNTAVIEMSSAAGITLLRKSELNPLYTTTYGVGEMIADAIKKGCRNFIIGIGGSATNDGGTGMLSALGFEFLDSAGKPIPLGAIGLEQLCSIRTENALKELKECIFNIACDVDNPLCGKEGCSAVFAPQKGADQKMVARMDKALFNYAKKVEAIFPNADMNGGGAGAAGGLGFAFSAFLNGKLIKGIDLVIKETRLEEKIKTADFVVTGEGRLDSQTIHGKAPIGVSRVAKKYNKPVLAFCGCATRDAAVCNDYGIDAFFPIVRGAVSLEEAMDKKVAAQNLQDTARQVFSLIRKLNP